MLDAFCPTFLRVALATGLAIAGFFLPQEIPLEWFPLSEPGDNILYLELTCASDKDGDVKVYYNATRGINELHTIYFPISPTEQTYTYTFPLPDAPITELRLDPVNKGGTLTIRRMRILDRRGTEIRRFTGEMFAPLNEVAGVTPIEDGWRITSTDNADDPYLRIALPSPILAEGRDHRNLLRCMLSTGYLAGMLWILLLAGFFAFVRPSSWRDLPGPLGYLALLAVLFAVVGNRGLIRNSIHYARFKVPPETVATRLEFDVWTKSASLSQLFWDTGQGFNEQQSARARHEPHWGLQTLQFELPPGPFRALRFDPLDGEGVITIRGVRVVDDGNRTRALLPRDCLLPEAQIAKLFGADDLVTIQTTAASHDPITGFTPEAVALINRARSTNAPAAR